MKKWFVTLLVLAGIGYGGFYFYRDWQARARRARNSQLPKIANVEARDIRFSIVAAGDIGPADQVSVRPEVNGRIAELPVDIGDEIKKSDLLFSLDDQDLQIERSTRLTEIEGAKLQREKAKRNFERAQQLFKENLIAREVFEDTKTEFELASNVLERSDTALRLVEDRLSKTRIMAPFDCTVLTRPVSVGQAVSGSGGFNSGTEVMTIANLKDMIISAHVSQADVTRLHHGQKVEVEVDSVPGLKMKGMVERIAPQATVKNNLKGFSARIAIKSIDARVRPGMTANLSIPVDSVEGVLAVPLAAVFTEKGERYVFIKKGETFQRITVQVGISDFNFAEITSGLTPGDQVALRQPDDFIETSSDGAPVSKKKKSGKGSGGRTSTNSTASGSTPPRPAL